MADMTRYDVVIIGGGAAGLSAALVLSRARRRVLVVDEGSPRNAPAAHMQGFLSRDGMPPSALLTAGRADEHGERFSVGQSMEEGGAARWHPLGEVQDHRAELGHPA